MQEKNYKLMRAFKTFPSKYKDCSNQVRVTYSIALDDNGHNILVKNGEYNQYDEIQSYADSVDFDRILQRIALGDTSMLRVPNDANFIDTSNIPDSPFEVIKLKQDNITRFNELPNDVKKLFGYDFENFSNSVANNTIDKIMENLGQKNGSFESNNSNDSGGNNK